MRGKTAIAIGLLALLAAGGAATRLLSDASPERPAPQPADPAAETKETRPPVHRTPRKRAAAAEPPVDADVELQAAWDAALALHKAGDPIAALAGLAPWRKARPEWFAEASRAKLIAEMERAALAALSRAVRTKSLDEVRRLAAALQGLVLDADLLRKAADLLAAAERRAAAVDPSVGEQIIDRTDVLADKQALARHLQRFADRGGAPKTKDWVDQQLGALEAANKILAKEPDPLPIPDPADAEKRRLDQLEKLRQRNAIGLLDSIDGSLAWLALHQADDGRFGADATNARCKALGHNPACVLDANAKEQYALAATGLSVLAFLDFRDQDVKRLFEPTLSRGIKWVLDQQNADGSFKPQAATGWAKGYAWAIGLMALGQAAASTHDPQILDAAQRGIDFYAKHHGKNGGYRYNLDSEGDLSVTGWYVQALEAARNAGAKIPEDMTQSLDRFLDGVWRSPPRHAFAYTVDRAESPSLDPVGMLVMSILRPDSTQMFGDEWREFLGNGKTGANNVYFLYYGVRVFLFLDGKVTDKWRKALNELAGKQVVTGAGAGMIPLEKDGSFSTQRGVGATIATAFATLTLEHSLYRR